MMRRVLRERSDCRVRSCVRLLWCVVCECELCADIPKSVNVDFGPGSGIDGTAPFYRVKNIGRGVDVNDDLYDAFLDHLESNSRFRNRLVEGEFDEEFDEADSDFDSDDEFDDDSEDELDGDDDDNESGRVW